MLTRSFGRVSDVILSYIFQPFWWEWLYSEGAGEIMRDDSSQNTGQDEAEGKS
jgi:hypothetical protein